MPPYSAHLLVVVHGLWGTTSHIGYICKSALVHSQTTTLPSSRSRSSSPTRSSKGDVRLVVLAPETNAWVNTYDGIDLCAERVVKEIDDECKRIEEDGGKVERFSIVGYSLGGLISRYALGLLESRTPSFFQDVRPVNFATFASPAIGIPRYKSFWSTVIRFLGSRLLSRSGSQLYENDRFLPESFINPPSDDDKTKCPPGSVLGRLVGRKEKAEGLLSVLADPNYSFYKALKAFERIEIYANTVNDRTVPFPTGAIEEHDPFALARAKAQKVADASGDPEAELDIREGGLEIILEKGSAVIESYGAIEPPSLASAAASGASTSKKKRPYKFQLPLLLRPTTYPFSRPVSLFIIVFLPLTLPLSVFYLVGRFLIQTRQSRRRIRDARLASGGGREGMLERVGVRLREVAEMTGADNPEFAAGLQVDGDESTAAPSLEDNERTTLKHPAFEALASYGGTDTPPLSRPLSPPRRNISTLSTTDHNDATTYATDPVLSEAQRTMIKNLNALPQMRKHLVYLPESRNSHGSIVARDLSFPMHRHGIKVVDRWAKEFRL